MECKSTTWMAVHWRVGFNTALMHNICTVGRKKEEFIFEFYMRRSRGWYQTWRVGSVVEITIHRVLIPYFPFLVLVKKVTSVNLGYRMGNKKIGTACYADDAAIIAESENDLQGQLFKFFQASHQLNTNISTSKTKCMTIAKEPLRYKLVVEDKPMEQLMQFRYRPQPS